MFEKYLVFLLTVGAGLAYSLEEKLQPPVPDSTVRPIAPVEPVPPVEPTSQVAPESLQFVEPVPISAQDSDQQQPEAPSGSDLKTDATFWWGRSHYPYYYRKSYYPHYRSYYSSYSPRSYSYWYSPYWRYW